MSHALSRHYISPGGRLAVEVVSSRVLATKMSGRLDLPLARYLLESLDAWVRLGDSQLVGLHDWEEVVDYDSEARTFLTPWSKANRPKFDGVHILIRGRALAWGINIVNGLTGGVMKVHYGRDSFAEARRSAGRRTG